MISLKKFFGQSFRRACVVKESGFASRIDEKAEQLVTITLWRDKQGGQAVVSASASDGKLGGSVVTGGGFSQPLDGKVVLGKFQLQGVLPKRRNHLTIFFERRFVCRHELRQLLLV